MRKILVDLFFDLLEVNIVAAVIIIVLSIFAGRLRKRYGAGWMKIIWILLAVRLLVPYNFSIMPLAGISFAGNVISDRPDAEQGSVPFSEASSNADTVDSLIVVDGSGVQDMTNSAGQNIVLQDHTSQTMHEESSEEREGSANPTEKNAVTGGAAWGNWLSGFHDTYVEILTAVWILGVLVCMFNTVISYVMFLKRYQKGLYPIEEERMKEIISRTGNRISVFQSRQISSPMLIGMIRPKLVIPTVQKQWTAAELQLIIEHEFCHYQKKDLLLKLLMTLVCCVNWMNPAVYLMRKQFFYDIELACDETALLGRDLEERELYARTMLSLAGNQPSAFSSSFLESKKQLKGRIDNIFDLGNKKNGFVSAVMVCIAFPLMGLVVSCGYQPDGTVQTDTNISETVSTEILSSDENEISTDGQTAVGQSDDDSFDYNNEYNEMLRVYKNDVYLAKENGIYYIKDGQGDGELLYQDDYRLRRGMEIDKNFLYFCGTAQKGDEVGATIYRLNLDTREMVDALAVFSQKFESLYNICIYEGRLYVASDYGSRIGFELNQNGEIVRQLDETADDFLYKEYNDYAKLQWQIWNTEYDSDEYWSLSGQLGEKYVAAIDVGACKKLLNGSHVVSKYKDELLRSYYLEKEDGTYELLCDTTAIPPIITENGMYYFDEINRIWYVDFETRQPELFYENQSRKSFEINMINYDADYVYATQERTIGYNAEGYRVEEMYLIRISRAGGEAQNVYRFEDPEISVNGLYNHCAVYGKTMYLDSMENIVLDPDANGMQRINSGEPCEDAVAMRDVAETFAAAYFENDETVLRSLLTEDFAGTPELYYYPENAAQIRENYLAGLPDDNIEVGVSCWLSYEFSGHVESEGVYVYLSMDVIKTEDGFRIKSYGLEQ